MKWMVGNAARGLAAAMAGLLIGAPAGAQDAELAALLNEAAARNPEVLAARREAEAATNRVEPAAALDDPMLEAGFINVPVPSLSLRREDMTMKMVGLTQRLPYPGKRALRREAAEKEAQAAEYTLRELRNKVRRDVKIAYFDLALVDESQRVTQRNLGVLEQLSSIAESRYSVGQASQADVLKAQTQRARMQEELIKLARERRMLEADLNRVVGRAAAPASLTPAALQPVQTDLDFEALRASARTSRPLLLGQESSIGRNLKTLELARKDYYPDFDLRFSYGQRDNFEGMRRDDMITFTVAINLPVWRQSRREPRVAEAQALREQASAMYEAKLNETDAMLRQQLAAAEQSVRSARLYETALIPQARLAAEASLSAYRVGRVDFFGLLESQMTLFGAQTGYAAALASYRKALAEIELLTGTELPIRSGS